MTYDEEEGCFVIILVRSLTHVPKFPVSWILRQQLPQWGLEI